MGDIPTGMPSGRMPKPTALKQLHGENRPSRINRREPRIQPGRIEPPNSLSIEARKCWDDLAPTLIASGVMTSADVKMFAEFCESTVIVRLARIQVLRFMTGEFEMKPGGANPYNSYARAISVLVNLASRFGLTPADRARLVVGDEAYGADDLISI